MRKVELQPVSELGECQSQAEWKTPYLAWEPLSWVFYINAYILNKIVLP